MLPVKQGRDLPPRLCRDTACLRLRWTCPCKDLLTWKRENCEIGAKRSLWRHFRNTKMAPKTSFFFVKCRRGVDADSVDRYEQYTNHAFVHAERKQTCKYEARTRRSEDEAYHVGSVGSAAHSARLGLYDVRGRGWSNFQAHACKTKPVFWRDAAGSLPLLAEFDTARWVAPHGEFGSGKLNSD